MVSIRWYYRSDLAKWEAKETAGKTLTEREQRCLAAWRRFEKKLGYELESIEVHGVGKNTGFAPGFQKRT